MAIAPYLMGNIPVEIVDTPYPVTIGTPICDYPSNYDPSSISIMTIDRTYYDQLPMSFWPRIEYGVFADTSNAAPAINGIPAAFQCVKLGRFYKTRAFINPSAAPMALNPAPAINGVTTAAYTSVQMYMNGSYWAPAQYPSINADYLWPQAFLPIKMTEGQDVYDSLHIIGQTHNPPGASAFLALLNNEIVSYCDNSIGSQYEASYLTRGGKIIGTSSSGLSNGNYIVSFFKNRQYLFNRYYLDLYLLTQKGGAFVSSLIDSVALPSGVRIYFAATKAFIGYKSNTNYAFMFRPDFGTYYTLECYSSNPSTNLNCSNIQSAAMDPEGYLYITTGYGNYGVNASKTAQWVGVSKYPVMLPPPKIHKTFSSGNGTVFGHLRWSGRRFG